MISRIAKQMLQRITDFIHDGSVKLCILTGDDQFHLLIESLGKIPDHARELIDAVFNRNHSNLHNRLMKICSDPLKVFYLLGILISTTLSTVFAGRSGGNQ